LSAQQDSGERLTLGATLYNFDIALAKGVR